MGYSKGIAAKISNRTSGKRHSNRHAGTLQVSHNFVRITGTDGKVVYIDVDSLALLREVLGTIPTYTLIDLFGGDDHPEIQVSRLFRNLDRKLLKEAGFAEEEINELQS